MLANIFLDVNGLVSKSNCHMDFKELEDVCYGDSKVGNVFVGKLQLILTNI